MKKPHGRLIHGQKRVGKVTPEYKTWLRIKSRCYRESDKDFPNWGGRGIQVCDRWVNDFIAFFSDMGERPSDKHSIDRIDSNGMYSPENCRWATLSQQGSENRRGLVPVTVKGMAFKTLKAACIHFGIGPTTLNERLRAGIPIEEAFTPGRIKSRRTKESYWRKSNR